jgi:hypothetical protein
MSSVLDVYEYSLGNLYTRNLNHCEPGNQTNFIHLPMTNITNNANCGSIKTQSSKSNIPFEDRSCDLFSGEIEEMNIKNQMNFTTQNLPTNLHFNISFPQDRTFSLTSQHLYDFIQINGAKISSPLDIEKRPLDANMQPLSRSSNVTYNPPQMRSGIYSPPFVSSLLNELETAFRRDCPTLNIQTDQTYIKVLKPDIDDKFIVIGDLHGSFHTLVRNLFRFRASNIIDENFKIAHDYKIIFLGDILDRGWYGYECLVLISLLKLNNSGKVFINRGNHEEIWMTTKESFIKEIQNKNIILNNGLRLDYSDIIRVLSLSHSALMIRDPHTKHFIWLSHGGIPINNNTTIMQEVKNISNNPSSAQDVVLNDETMPADTQIRALGDKTRGINPEPGFLNKPDIMQRRYSPGTQIKWNDFSGVVNTVVNTNRGVGYILGQDVIREMQANNILFAIRAHQDQTANTKIYYNNNPNPISIHASKAIPDHSYKCNGYVNSFYLNQQNLMLERNNIGQPLLPVIVLSTNTDCGRDLQKDSFSTLQFMTESQRNERLRKNSNRCILENEPEDVLFISNIGIKSTNIFPNVGTDIDDIIERKLDTKRDNTCFAGTVSLNEIRDNCAPTQTQEIFNSTYGKLSENNNKRCPEFARRKLELCSRNRGVDAFDQTENQKFEHKWKKYRSKNE